MIHRIVFPVFSIVLVCFLPLNYRNLELYFSCPFCCILACYTDRLVFLFYFYFIGLEFRSGK